MLEVKGLTKRYNSIAAVDDVSFRIDPGEVYGRAGARPIMGGMSHRRRHRSEHPRLIAMRKPSVHGARSQVLEEIGIADSRLKSALRP